MLKKGFTLVELMVSVGIFCVVMIVALGALLAMVEASRKAQTLNTVINNLNFTLESMTRQIRTGYDYKCGSPSGGDCSNGGTYLAMTSADGVRKIAFCFDSATRKLKRQITTGSLAVDCSNSAFLPLTAQDVVIEAFNFYVVGTARTPTDTVQPRVTVLMSGYVLFSEGQRTQFNIQTVLTQRVYDQ